MEARFAGSWRTNRALESFRELAKVIDQLTEEEVYFCLCLEAESQRRVTVMDKLLNRVLEISKAKLLSELKEKYGWMP